MPAFKILKEQIQKILEEDHRTRDSDTLLTALYWVRHDRHLVECPVPGVYMIDLKVYGLGKWDSGGREYMKLTSASEIERVRRLIQEEAYAKDDIILMGKYCPTTKAVLSARGVKNRKWTDIINQNKIEYIVNYVVNGKEASKESADRTE